MSVFKLSILAMLLILSSALGRAQLTTDPDADAAVANGTLNLWSHAYGSGSLSGVILPVTGATGYYLSASQPTINKGKDNVVALLSAAGAVTWAKEIDPGTKNTDALSFEPLATGFRLTGIVQQPSVANQNMLVWTQFDKTWKRTYGWGYSVNGAMVGAGPHDTSDGGMLFTGSLAIAAGTKLQCIDTMLLKTDANGNMQWNNVWQYGCVDLAGPVAEVKDGYLVAGMLSDPVTKIHNLFLMKHALTGAGTLWTKMYSIPITTLDFFGAVTYVKVLSSGNILLVGSLQELNPILGGNSLFMVELNSSGGLLWANNYKLTAGNLSPANVIENTTAKTLLVSGSEMNLTAMTASIDLFVVNTASGAIVQQQKLSSATHFDMGAVVKSTSGDLYFSGTHGTSMTDTYPKTLYGKLNATTLNPIWTNLFSGGAGLAIETSTGFLLTGLTKSYGYNAAKGNVFGMLVDKSGNYPSCHIGALAMAASLPMVTSTPLSVTIGAPAWKTVTAGTLTGVAFPVASTTVSLTNICPAATVPADLGFTKDGSRMEAVCAAQSTAAPVGQNEEIKHGGGSYGNKASFALRGSGSQSTLAVSPATGTLFEDEQQNGQVHWRKTDGTTGQFFPGVAVGSPTQIAVDDNTGKVVRLVAGTSTVSPQIQIYDESGDGGFPLCRIDNTGMSFISSIAAKGGYMVFTDSVEDLVGIARMDCTGYTTVKVAGQPWSVAMTSGAKLDAYVLSRDKCANGLPCLTKLGVPLGTYEGMVDLTGITPVSTILATTPYEGIYQVQAFSLSSTAAVLFMSDDNDGTVLTIGTDTSNGAKMKVTHVTPVAELPIGITTQETASSSTLWVAYIAAASMDAVTHIGAIDPTTGNYTSAIGACRTGILASGFIATTNGVYCGQGAVIAPPLALVPQ